MPNGKCKGPSWEEPESLPSIVGSVFDSHGLLLVLLGTMSSVYWENMAANCMRYVLYINPQRILNHISKRATGDTKSVNLS